MEQENFNKDGQEATDFTRWVLAVGIGVLLVFLVVAFLWFGLISQPRSSQTPTALAAQPNTITALPTPTLSEQATAVATPATTEAVISGPTAALFPTDTPVIALSVPEISFTTPVPIFSIAPTTADTPTVDSFATVVNSDTPTVNSFATALASSPTALISPSDNASSTPTPDVTTNLATSTASTPSWPETAAANFDQLQTMHFIIDIRGGKVQILPETDLKHAEGDLSHSTGDFQAKILATIFVGDVTVQTVRVNGDQYLTSPIGGQWAKLSPSETFDLAVLFDPKNGIGALNRQLQNVSMLSDETIANVDCVHFQGTLPGSAVGPISYGTLGHNPVTLEEWVGRDDKLIRQIYLKETTTNGAFWVINLSNFNESLNIKKPNA